VTPRRWPALAAVALALAASPAAAEVTAVSPHGFTLSYSRPVPATPAQAFEAIGRVDRWWNAAHSYSGQAANLRLTLRAGDCFCEQWDGGSVEHLRVVLVRAPQMVRLEGALGPLQELAVRGVLTFATAVADGRSVLRMTYRVSGAPEAGLEKLAPLVDRVMGDQFARWADHVESQRP
jgi:hypothetical protein